MSAAEKRFPTGEQYLAWEREADFKSEYLAGEIYAMSGAALNHNIIATNLTREISNHLKGRPCQVLGSDMRVQVEAADAYFYPDLSGLCGGFDFHDDRRDTYKNPHFVIEILSDSTESYDRGKKFFHYQSLPSLKEYVLVSQGEVAVEIYRKDGDRWIYQLITVEGAALKLESVDCEVPLSEIYRNVTFAAEQPAPATRDAAR
jgi:Uma2 family endonuclease